MNWHFISFLSRRSRKVPTVRVTYRWWSRYSFSWWVWSTSRFSGTSVRCGSLSTAVGLLQLRVFREVYSTESVMRGWAMDCLFTVCWAYRRCFWVGYSFGWICSLFIFRVFSLCFICQIICGLNIFIWAVDRVTWSGWVFWAIRGWEFGIFVMWVTF